MNLHWDGPEIRSDVRLASKVRPSRPATAERDKDGRRDEWSGRCTGPDARNRQMRRVLNQAANAAVKAKGTIFAVVYRRLVARLGHAQAIGVIAHRLCRLIWKILHQSIRYEERGPAVSEEAKKVRARKMIRELRSLGYHVERLLPPSGSPP